MPEDYMHKYLDPLVGMRVTAIAVSRANEDAGRYEDEYALKLENKRTGAVCYAWIMCDEEGNGPGHLDLDWEKR